MKTETPKSDAARMTEQNGCITTFNGREIVPASFARQLETELATTTAENAVLRDAVESWESTFERFGIEPNTAMAGVEKLETEIAEMTKKRDKWRTSAIQENNHALARNEQCDRLREACDMLRNTIKIIRFSASEHRDICRIADQALEESK